MALEKEQLAKDIVDSVLKSIDTYTAHLMKYNNITLPIRMADLPEDEKKYLDRLVEKKIIEAEIKNGTN